MLKITVKFFLLILLTQPIFSKSNAVVKTVPSKETIAIASELLETMHMKHTYQGMIARITQMQLQQNPQLLIIKPTIHGFFKKYMGWEALKSDIAYTYASVYTQDELKEINKFYQTKVGQKSVHLMPELASRGARIGQHKLMLHMPELQTMIEKALKKHHQSK